MLTEGNTKLRPIYEKYAPQYFIRPDEAVTNTAIREYWIRQKYEHKTFHQDSKKGEDGLRPCQTWMPEPPFSAIVDKMSTCLTRGEKRA